MLRLISIFLSVLYFNTHTYAQPAGCAASTSARCDGWPLSKIDMDQQGGGSLVEFVFDDLSKYNAGITKYGTTILRVTASDTANNDCAWKLRMIVNNGGTPTPSDEWLQTAAYGSSGAIPDIIHLEVRVTNSCSTSPMNGIWQTFNFPENAGEIVIIDDGSFVNMAGNISSGCSGNPQVNSEGSFLTSPGEFMFVVDYRIRPYFVHAAGKYELNLKFCISEDL